MKVLIQMFDSLDNLKKTTNFYPGRHIILTWYSPVLRVTSRSKSIPFIDSFFAMVAVLIIVRRYE